MLLAAGAAVEAVDIHGQMPLFLANHRGRSQQVVTVLLGAGAAVDKVDSHGQTPLFTA